MFIGKQTYIFENVFHLLLAIAYYLFDFLPRLLQRACFREFHDPQEYCEESGCHERL